MASNNGVKKLTFLLENLMVMKKQTFVLEIVNSVNIMYMTMHHL